MDRALRARTAAEERGRLGTSIRRRQTTALIGSLARFEAAFGELWGHGKHEDELTAAERRWRAAWEACREGVLNHGNGLIRATEKDLTEYRVERLTTTRTGE
jgi:hypothetical protein